MEGKQMGTNTQYNHLVQAEKQITRVYKNTISLKRTTEEHFKEMKNYYENNYSYNKLNQRNKAYISGVSSTLWKEIESKIVWVHRYTNRLGNLKQVKKWEQMPKKIRFDQDSFKSLFVWKSDETKEW